MAKALKQSNRKHIPRETRKFQLRKGEGYPIDQHVSEILNYSRTKRREVTVIRDGVRLLWALENNDLSVLFDMFPHLREQFLPEKMTLIEQVQFMLSKTAVGQGGNKPALGIQPTDKQLTAARFDMPVFKELDDEPTIILRPQTSTDSSMNFVSALRNME